MDKNNTDLGIQVTREELVESFSRHANLSNKYMLGILFVSVIFVMNISPTDKIKLPFIEEIDVKYYYFISLSLLSGLIILFSSAHLMALRIRQYYNIYFNKTNDKDYIDLTVEPTIFRVAPISWMIKNKDVFFINITAVNENWKKVEIVIYFILKALVFIVSYLFPIITFILMLYKSGIFNFSKDINLISRLILITISITSIIAFCIVLKNEIVFTLKMPSKIYSKKK